MNKVRWFEPREVRELFHYKKVSLSLGEEPLVGIKSDLGVDGIEKLPRVGQIALVDILPLRGAISAEYWPRDSCLELQMVKRD
jgi:hypothetical protein